MTGLSSALRCPACEHGLIETRVDDLTVDVCEGGCGGIWFDNGEIEAVDDRDEVAGEALVHIDQRWALEVDHSRKRACPRCDGILMLGMRTDNAFRRVIRPCRPPAEDPPCV